MKFKIILVLAFLLFQGKNILSQNIPINNDITYFYENSINFDSSEIHFTVKPYRADLFSYNNVYKTEKQVLYSLTNKNLLNISSENLNLKLNPVINSMFFYDFSQKDFMRDYKGGINFYTSYKNKISISGDFFVSEVSYPSFFYGKINEFNIVPYYGKYIDKQGNNLFFASFTGDFVYKANKNISFSAGKNKIFLGNGYRSLFLSDNSASYPYVKTEIDIWKIKYLWAFIKLSDVDLSLNSSRDIFYDKAAFVHYFSINLTRRINFDFFEAVITNPYDSQGRRISYDAVYFNPVIFYRPVEFYKGTSDNSLMGTALNIRIFKSTFLYSQFILDDLVISSLKDGSGWWGNKFGIQTGAKSYNIFGIKGLFARGEINIVRPYTYSHGEAYITNGIANLNYGNYGQALSHPLGANFKEAISEIKFTKDRFLISGKIIFAKKGEDIGSFVSYGGDIYKSYSLRPADYGIELLQGEMTDILSADLSFSYLINPEYNLMFKTGIYYNEEKNSVNNYKNSIIYFGLTTGIFNSFFD